MDKPRVTTAALYAALVELASHQSMMNGHLQTIAQLLSDQNQLLMAQQLKLEMMDQRVAIVVGELARRAPSLVPVSLSAGSDFA